MQAICTSLQTDNHSNTSSLNFYRPNQRCQSIDSKSIILNLAQQNPSSVAHAEFMAICRLATSNAKAKDSGPKYLQYSTSAFTADISTHPFNGSLSGTTQVSQYQKDKTNLDFTEARDSGWQWHQLGHMQICTSLQTNNHASTPPLSFFTGWMPFLPPNQQCQSTEGLSRDNRRITHPTTS